MNHKSIILIVTPLVAAAISWTAFAAPPAKTPAQESKDKPTPTQEDKANATKRMDDEQKRVLERLHISAPMEIELINGVDPIMQAYEEGFIIEASLEQVEGALAAAALTKDPQDDLDALELKHRGSYRFFTPDSERTMPETQKKD